MTSNALLSVGQTEGALTLESVGTFDLAQHLDFHSPPAISAETALAEEELMPETPHRWQTRETRISIVAEPGSRRIPDLSAE